MFFNDRRVVRKCICFSEPSDANSSETGTLALAADNFVFVIDGFLAAPIRPSKDGRLIARRLRGGSNANFGRNISQTGTLAPSYNFAFVMDAFSSAPIRPSKDGRLIARALRRDSNANLVQNIA